MLLNTPMVVHHGQPVSLAEFRRLIQASEAVPPKHICLCGHGTNNSGLAFLHRVLCGFRQDGGGDR